LLSYRPDGHFNRAPHLPLELRSLPGLASRESQALVTFQA
jgi:hypothetical protein